MQKNNIIKVLLALFVVSCSPLAEVDDPSGSGQGGPQTYSDSLDVLWKYVWAYYPFDNDANNSVKDESGYEVRKDGTIFGEGTINYVSDTPSGRGKALMLNGDRGQYVNIPHNLFKDLDRFTISFWIKDFSTGAIISGINPSRVESDYYQNNHWPKLFMRNDGYISFDAEGRYYDFYDDSPKFTYNYTSIQSAGWHHVAVTYTHPSDDDSRGTSNLYIDGVLVDNQTIKWRNPNNMTKINIGGDGSGCFPVAPSMKIDNVAVYYASWSATYIKFIYLHRL